MKLSPSLTISPRDIPPKFRMAHAGLSLYSGFRHTNEAAKVVEKHFHQAWGLRESAMKLGFTAAHTAAQEGIRYIPWINRHVPRLVTDPLVAVATTVFTALGLARPYVKETPKMREILTRDIAKASGRSFYFELAPAATHTIADYFIAGSRKFMAR